MNKSELSTLVSDRMSVSKNEARIYIDTLAEIMEEAFINGNNVILQNFGSFTVWEQSERPGRNPRTGETVCINARKSIKFKPGKSLLNKLNKKK